VNSTALEAYVRRLSEELRRRWLDDDRLVAESREHLVDRIEDGVRRGLSREAAEQQAFGGFGSPEAVAECAAAERYQMWNRWGFLAVVWDRKWWILIPTIASAVIASVASYYLMPVRYQSEASLELIPVSTEHVPGRTKNRLKGMSDVLTSRTRLERVIEDLNLYERERRTTPIESVIRQMRRDISITTTTEEEADVAAFVVRFEAPDPRLAQLATARLASLFVEENMRRHELQTAGDFAVLDTQIDNVKRQLESYEDNLAVSSNKAHRRTAAIEYEVMQSSYKELLSRRQESILAAGVERRQTGEQIRIVDPPRIPERPVGLSPAQFGAIGGGSGLVLGLAFIASARRRRDG
jgi:uncharacterized protein involved in exopolysaccharide biosynthesis